MIGRQLRRIVLPLVGYWDLRALAEENRMLLTALGREVERNYKMTADLFDRQAAREERNYKMTADLLAKEIERLDGYLVHHAANLHRAIGNHTSALRVAIDAVRATVDEHAVSFRSQIADTRLMHGSRFEAIGAQLEDLRAQITAASSIENRPIYLAAGLNVILHMYGYDLIVPCSEEGLLTYLIQHRDEAVDAGVRSVIAKRLRPGAVAIDGGAKVGLYAVMMAAAIGPDGSLICFEPVELLAEVLERTLRLNGFASRAKVEQVAISDSVGQMTFYVARNSPTSSLFELPENDSARSVAISTTSLDSFIPVGGRVDFLKLDIEGAQPRAWRGMRRVIEENHQIELVIEWSASHFARSGENPTHFMHEIRSAGFNLFVIEDTPLPGELAPLNDNQAMMLEATNLLVTRKDR
jgi:FkbM family methyltransferase